MRTTEIQLVPALLLDRYPIATTLFCPDFTAFTDCHLRNVGVCPHFEEEMADLHESPMDRLWREYGAYFKDLDDLTLARWLAQTFGQLEGRVWRMSHPLVGALRLACQTGADRAIWHKRLVSIPRAYVQAPCCGAPMLPMVTRDVLEVGLACHACNETAVPYDEIPAELQKPLKEWVDKYLPIHAVAHWDDRQRRACPNYDEAVESAAKEIEQLLVHAGKKLLPPFLDHYPAMVWEDQDECLEVRPDDIRM